ncbi:hypothetical protein [Weissella paramesenteroides]|uniref:hypothetical protein n=1 Tax=Weissella paramesenteroides TaxID=1249 RepID=UPI003D36625C
MGNFLKKYKYVFYIIIIIMMLLVFIGIPILIQRHIGIVYELAKKMTPGNHSDWIQFWGSYFEFIPTGLITFMVLVFQFKRQEEADEKNFEKQLKKQKQEFLFEQEVLKTIELQHLSIDNYQILESFKENISEKREDTREKWDTTWKKIEYNRSTIQIWQDSLIVKRLKNFEGVDNNLSLFSDFNDISEKKKHFDKILSSQSNHYIDDIDLAKLTNAVSEIADNYSNIYNLLVEYEVNLEKSLSA